MTAFECPEHGNLVLDLTRGQLDDKRAEEAEKARQDCAVCSRWWDETFSDAAMAELDSEVASVFREIEPPRRRRRGWLAAAAAAALVIGGGTLSTLWRETPTPQPRSGDHLATWDFEAGTVSATVESDDFHNEAEVFAAGFESGDRSGWSAE